MKISLLRLFFKYSSFIFITFTLYIKFNRKILQLFSFSPLLNTCTFSEMFSRQLNTRQLEI